MYHYKIKVPTCSVINKNTNMFYFKIKSTNMYYFKIKVLTCTIINKSTNMYYFKKY